MRDIESTQNLLKQFLLGKGFDGARIDEANERARSLIADTGLLQASGSFLFRVQRGFVIAETKGFLPKDVAVELTNVAQMAADGKDIGSILANVDSKVRSRLQQGCNARYADVFIDVSRHSREFWTAQDGQAAGLKPGTGTIIADGAGALYGLLGGPLAPVLSIVEATLFSVLANEAD